MVLKQALMAVPILAVALAGCLDNQSDADEAHVELAYLGLASLPAIDAAALVGELRSFADSYSERAANLPDHVGARDYLADQFESFGLDVWRQNFTNGIEQENIAGIKWGEKRDEWVIVGAHYDMVTTDCIAGTVINNVPTVGDAAPDCVTRPYSQGIYDDGSGTLMTVHLAQAFANLSTQYTIAFVGFDGEERGLQGSGAFAETLFTGETPWGPVKVRGMLNLDMIGLNWPGVDAPIYFDSNSPEMEARVAELGEELGFPEGMIKYQGITLGRSDYAHFMDQDAPTGFFISDFEEWELPADSGITVPCEATIPRCTAYPFWHVQDTWETMVLMAGSEEDVIAGFETATNLAAGVIFLLAVESDDLSVA